MRRREFFGLAAGAAAAWPLVAQAQQAKSVLRIGVAQFEPRPPHSPFERRMGELGYKEGVNWILDYVQIGPDKSLEDAYREIAARNPDILLAWGPEAALKAGLAASQTTPIVMIAIDYDPIAHGYASSLARPGGRITGLFLQQIELTVKRLHFFKEAIPDFNSAIVFYDAFSRDQWKGVEDAGTKLGLRLSGIDMHDPPYDYDRGLAETPPDNRKNLFMPTSPVFFADRERLAKFALRNRLSSMFAFRDWVVAGGLMSYGANFDRMLAQTADIIDRIGRGAKPGDLPIEQPTKFEFVINLATARALGLEFPPTLLGRADEVIE
jgi:putative ABC transport system substrate-binding protein